MTIPISDAEISRIRMVETAAVDVPPAGHGYLRTRTDGLYFMGDDGVDVGPLADANAIPTILNDLTDVVFAGTATGDIIYRNGANQWVNLPIGLNGYMLSVVAGLPAWVDFTAPIDIPITAGENLSERDIAYVRASDNLAYQADIDATGPVDMSSLVGFVTTPGGILAAAAGTMRVMGIVTGFAALTAGFVVYAHTTAGGYTQTKPTVADGGVQKAIKVMGFALSTTTVLVVPSGVVYAKRATLADAASLTIEHHIDASAPTREAFATILTGGYDELCAMGRSSAGTRDIGARYDNGAGANPTTNTTFTNRTGGAEDITIYVRL